MIRNASLHCSSRELQFVPSSAEKSEENSKLEELAKKPSLSEGTISTAKELDSIFGQIKESFSASHDYLKVLVKQAENLVTEENKHLQLFHFLVPVLTMNYVEHILKSKEQIGKSKVSNLSLNVRMD